MNGESLPRTLAVALGVALFSSLLVSVTAVTLRPAQLAWAEIGRNRVIVELAGLLPEGAEAPDRVVATRYATLEARLVDLASGAFVDGVDPLTFDAETASRDPDRSVAVAEGHDPAGLGRRERVAPVWLVPGATGIERVVLPVRGKGMWSTIHGFVALDGGGRTVQGIAFHEHGETPGIGDRIERPDWRQSWVGKQVYDEAGAVALHPAPPEVAADDPHAFDAITGATVTVTSVTRLVDYWLGEDGYGPFLARLHAGEVTP